jgi:hypothetical protein
MNFFQRLQGTFFSPDLTFKSLASKPVWVDACLLILVAALLYTFLINPYLQQDQLQLMENNVELRERYGDEQIDQMLETMRNPPQWRIITKYVMAPVGLLAGLLIASLILLALGRMGSTEGRFIQIFAVLVHASFIDKLLGNAVRAFLVLYQKSFFQSTTTLAAFFPRLEVTSASFIVLSQIDFFQLWMFGILALGLVHIFKIERRRAFFISYTFWFLKSALHIGVILMSMRLFM